YISLGLFFLLP
ncbi:putative membrane protein, partial [Escherichia coli 95.0183]